MSGKEYNTKIKEMMNNKALLDGGRIKLGKKVLRNGASGGVGIFAVRIADSKGHGNRLTASN